MIICLGAFIALSLAMVLWPLFRLFGREQAAGLVTAWRAGAECIGKRTTFQKCEVRFEDRVKNYLLKSTILIFPHRSKIVALEIWVASLLVILLMTSVIILGIWHLVALIH